MSAFQQKTRSLGIRAGILAGASAAVLAVFGIGAGSAMAAPTCPGGTIAGQGSTLQKTAQVGTWNPKYNTACGAGSVAYTGTGSGAGLKALGFTGTEIEHAWQFIGTDEAPTKLQIEASNKLSKTSAVVIPVTQTAIAVVEQLRHLPHRLRPDLRVRVEAVADLKFLAVFGDATDELVIDLALDEQPRAGRTDLT